MQVSDRKLETQVQAIAGELFHGQILLTSIIAFSNAIKPKEIPGLY